ncbi:hypothetical protein VNO77_41986 [Canavalia gladiata]|uniref:Uncharacterized protein n=1 Tax=Canavalia gladiata TaxID=3824 RepID=A0AAN9K079_CANGL
MAHTRGCVRLLVTAALGRTIASSGCVLKVRLIDVSIVNFLVGFLASTKSFLTATSIFYSILVIDMSVEESVVSSHAPSPPFVPVNRGHAQMNERKDEDANDSFRNA